MSTRKKYLSFLTRNQGMPMVAVGWVVVIISGLTTFVVAKRRIDCLRMEKIRNDAKQRTLKEKS